MPLIPYHDRPEGFTPPKLRIRVLCDWCGDDVAPEDGTPPTVSSL